MKGGLELVVVVLGRGLAGCVSLAGFVEMRGGTRGQTTSTDLAKQSGANYTKWRLPRYGDAGTGQDRNAGVQLRSDQTDRQASGHRALPSIGVVIGVKWAFPPLASYGEMSFHPSSHTAARSRPKIEG